MTRLFNTLGIPVNFGCILLICFFDKIKSLKNVSVKLIHQRQIKNLVIITGSNANYAFVTKIVFLSNFSYNIVKEMKQAL